MVPVVINAPPNNVIVKPDYVYCDKSTHFWSYRTEIGGIMKAPDPTRNLKSITQPRLIYLLCRNLVAFSSIPLLCNRLALPLPCESLMRDMGN
jgi:hypothetical protein